MRSASLGVYNNQATGKQSVEAIQYIMALLGVPKNNSPSAPEMGMILNYLKVHFGKVTIEEIKLAFDLAVKKSFPATLELYGCTLSVKFISDVLNAYFYFKKSEMLKSVTREEGMNNYERVNIISGFLDTSTIEKINKLGTPAVKKEIPVREKTEAEILMQNIMREFDVLHREQENSDEGQRFVKYDGKNLSISEFLQIRLEEMNKI